MQEHPFRCLFPPGAVLSPAQSAQPTHSLPPQQPHPVLAEVVHAAADVAGLAVRLPERRRVCGQGGQEAWVVRAVSSAYRQWAESLAAEAYKQRLPCTAALAMHSSSCHAQQLLPCTAALGCPHPQAALTRRLALVEGRARVHGMRVGVGVETNHVVPAGPGSRCGQAGRCSGGAGQEVVTLKATQRAAS